VISGSYPYTHPSILSAHEVLTLSSALLQWTAASFRFNRKL